MTPQQLPFPIFNTIEPRTPTALVASAATSNAR